MQRLLLVALLAAVAHAGSSNTYKEGEPIKLYVNKVGPYHNPSETYDYYELPVCRPEKITHVSLTLGEVLTGDRLSESMFVLPFAKNIEKEKLLCQLHLETLHLERLHDAIEEFYYFEFIVDGLPLYNFIGDFEEINLPFHMHKIYLFSHFHFMFLYHGENIISANVTMSKMPPHDITRSNSIYDIDITYSAEWLPTEVTYEQRHTVVNNYFFPKAMEIHWFSIVNSIIMVILLTGLVIGILARVLKSDFARYAREDEEADTVDDYGWKQVHGDVFRFPPFKNLFCAIVGVGSQFLILAFVVLIMALLGLFHPHHHGAMVSATIILFALTSCFAGYISGSLFKQLGGENWVWNILLTASLFAVPFFGVWAFVNSIAWYHQATQALPWTTVLVIMLIWLFIGFPLTVFGGIIGKNNKQPFEAPTRTKNIPREIPVLPWYLSGPCQMFVGGFLPFSAVSVELFYLFSTLWGRESYTFYGILFLVFLIVLEVTACITIALTYFQLSTEDYRWWWRSLLNAGATGLFVFAYAAFFFNYRSSMSGFFQTTQFYGYVFLICYVFFLILGTVGFASSLYFVRFLFKQLKTD